MQQTKIMKFLIGTGLVLLLVITGVWFSMDMDGMSMDQNGVMNGTSVSEGKSLTRLPENGVTSIRPTEIVELKDGDTYDMVATIVSQEIGNRTVKRLAYNGQIPGPVIKVQKNAKININFTNNIDMETALHSHGLRGDYLMDGAVPITPAIPVGESFLYELEFPDTGVFWYHPHVREDYQQEMGLYGNMIVEEEGYWNDVNQEAYLIVDDILEDGDFTSGVVTNTLMGRFGDTLLINDKEDYNLTVKAGEIIRVYITNVANTRTFDLSFDGAMMKLVGGDIGRIEKEKMIDSQIIGTAERYIIELYYKKSGVYPIMHHGKKMGIVTVEASDSNRQAEFTALRSNASDYADIRSNITELLAAKPDKNVRLDIEMQGKMTDMMQAMNNDLSSGARNNVDGSMMGDLGMGMMDREGEDNMKTDKNQEHSADGIEWEDDMAMMNGMSTDKNITWVMEDTDTGKKNDAIDWSFNQGDLVKVRIYNDEKGMHPMQHPIHFHGQRFVVLAEDGELNDNLQWEDTALIPAGHTVDLLVDMSTVGQWMAHCHIAEHLHSGMMFQFEVNSN